MGKLARYDSNRVKLRTGEYQKSDGRYEFRYTVFGKKYSVYAKSLDELREKEAEIYSVKTANQTRFDSRTTTLNDVFELWKELKRGLRPNTYQNYCYMYQQYVQESLGRQYIANIKKSDVKRFFNHLADERRLKEGTIEAVQTILHQVFQIAVDDEWIEKNPSDHAVKELKRSHQMDNKKRQALSNAEQELLLSLKIGHFVFLPEYEQLREDYFVKLGSFPVIRHKIFKLYQIKENKKEIKNLLDRYAQRIEWHIYRLYRTRNSIVHAGKSHKRIQVLGEHLHIYVDRVMTEIITKISDEYTIKTVRDVLIDADLLAKQTERNFDVDGEITSDDINSFTSNYYYRTTK